MDTTLQNAITRLLATASATSGAKACVLLRHGRFTKVYDSDGVTHQDIPSNALDTFCHIATARAVGGHIADLPAKLGADDLLCIPVVSESEDTLGLVCVARTDLAKESIAMLETFARTIAVLIETLDSAGEHATRLLHDPLTHLPNRAMLTQRLADEIDSAQRTNGRLCVFSIDLDNFAAINREYGHAIGDRMLQKIAGRLHHAVRRSDLPARLSKDEFAVIGTTQNEQPDGAHVANRLIKIISQPMEVDGYTITPAASVGIAVYPTDGVTVDALLHSAHAAMHRAKIRGRNTFEYFTPQLHAQAMERLELEKLIAMAIEKEQFVLHYQPIVDRAGRVTNVEALIRWNHPDGGLISPAKFIPVAEQTGLIISLGTWVLKTAAQQAAQWALQGIPLRVNANVSTLQFAKDDFVDLVNQVLERTAIDPQQLELEVTEGVFASESSDIAQKMVKLRSLGVRIAIDDFGAGYSSLSRVHSLPIDTLKIDRAFVNEITLKDAPTPLHHRTAVLRAMSTLGHSLGLKLVAEGVETNDQANFLRRIGYDAMQGYLYSKPVPADQIPAFVTRHGLSESDNAGISAAA